jgi:hypothetical protein
MVAECYGAYLLTQHENGEVISTANINKITLEMIEKLTGTDVFIVGGYYKTV